MPAMRVLVTGVAYARAITQRPLEICHGRPHHIRRRYRRRRRRHRRRRKRRSCGRATTRCQRCRHRVGDYGDAASQVVVHRATLVRRGARLYDLRG